MVVVPCRAIEGVVCFFVATEIGQRDTLEVESLGICGMLIAAGQTFDGNVAIIHAFFKFAILQAKTSHGRIATNVAVIASNTFQIVRLGTVVVLLVLL